MGGVVSTLAFPVPNRSYSEPMLKHQGDRLVWLMVTTENKKAVRNTRLKVPALHYQYPNAQFTVLYSHGNAEDLGINIPYLEQLSNTLQVNVLAYEYPVRDDGIKPKKQKQKQKTYFRGTSVNILICSNFIFYILYLLTSIRDIRLRKARNHRKYYAMMPSVPHTII